MQAKENFLTQLQDCSVQLAEKLQNNEIDAASDLIHNLIDARDKHIFNSVGQLTRALHNAIVNFHVDAQLETDSGKNNSDISDASDRLNYVIDMTQAAANKTMDRVEAVAPVAMELGEEAQQLRSDWQRLKRREMSKEEFKALYHKMGRFLDQMETGTSQLSNSLQEIILEQGYQDLTGQVLKKVIGLISEVESELVSLMRIAGQVEKVTGLNNMSDDVEAMNDNLDTAGEGPQIHADKREDVVSNQDDVDDLLSSLGF